MKFTHVHLTWKVSLDLGRHRATVSSYLQSYLSCNLKCCILGLPPYKLLKYLNGAAGATASGLHGGCAGIFGRLNCRAIVMSVLWGLFIAPFEPGVWTYVRLQTTAKNAGGKLPKSPKQNQCSKISLCSSRSCSASFTTFARLLPSTGQEIRCSRHRNIACTRCCI